MSCKYVYLLQHHFNFESSAYYCGDLITALKRWSIWPAIMQCHPDMRFLKLLCFCQNFFLIPFPIKENLHIYTTFHLKSQLCIVEFLIVICWFSWSEFDRTVVEFSNISLEGLCLAASSVHLEILISDGHHCTWRQCCLLPTRCGHTKK